MRRLAFWIIVVASALASFALVAAKSVPLGVAGEWEWDRVASVEPLWLTLVPLAMAAFLYVAYVGLGSISIERSGRLGLAGWLGGLAIAGFAWMWVAQESAPESFQLSKAVWVLYFRGSSGYFSEAREDQRSLPEYLRHYSAKMSEGDVLHIGTHPPGLVVAFRGLIAACERVPVLTDIGIATQPDSVRMAFEALESSSGPAAKPLSRVDRAVLWLAALIVQGTASLAVIPLYGLARRAHTRRASWLAAAFWPTVPALALFLPKSDCLYPLLTMGVLWLWLSGLDRGSLWRAGLAGCLLWLGMTLSLAFLVVACLAGAATIVKCFGTRGAVGGSPLERKVGGPSQSVRFHARYARLIWAFACAAAGFAVLTAAVWITLDLNLLSVWSSNSRNHAAFYGQFPRTWWKWLLVNPVELSMAAGAPLAACAAWSLALQLRSPRRISAEYAWSWVITLGLLWVSGKNMGEAARLWIFLMPFPSLLAAPLFETDLPVASQPLPRREPGLLAVGWLPLLIVQFVQAGAVVIQVTGFHYPKL